MSETAVGEIADDTSGPRLVVGLFLAPIIGCLLGGNLFVIGGQVIYAASGFDALRQPELWPVLAFVSSTALTLSILVGIPVSLVIGLAAHAALKRAGITHILAYAGAGIAIGFSALQAYLLVVVGAGTLDYGFPLLGAMCGGFAALTFWLIRRPDRDAPTQPQK